MSRIASIVNGRHIRTLRAYQGDHALFRPKHGEARSVTVILDVRDVQAFDGSSGSGDGPVSVVDTQQIWFLMFKQDLRNTEPKVDDEIVFDQKSYQISQVMDEVFDKVWVRVHEAHLSIGAFREF